MNRKREGVEGGRRKEQRWERGISREIVKEEMEKGGEKKKGI